jgi:GPH family glycoside/pentoside/hexuronide:cation symporter
MDGAIAGNAISRSKDVWLIFFFAPPADEPDLPTLIPRVTLGAVILAVRVIDALDDPIIGWWSDRTRSRWGRRIPFVVAATPFWVTFFVLLFTPPEGQGTLFYAVYVFLALEFFHLFSTLSGGPFESLLPEIARSPRDRVSIVTWQVAFGSLGAFVGLVLSGIIIDVFSFKVMAGAMAAVALVSRYLALGGVWNHVKLDVEPVRIGPLQAIRAT